MTDYRSGLWNDWYGQRGDTPPVMSGDLVEFFTRTRIEENLEADTMYGSALEFDWIDDESDIVKFRVIKKAEEMKFKIGDVVRVLENPYTSRLYPVADVGRLVYVTDVLDHGCQLALDSDCDPDEHSGRSLFFRYGQFEPYKE